MSFFFYNIYVFVQLIKTELLLQQNKKQKMLNNLFFIFFFAIIIPFTLYANSIILEKLKYGIIWLLLFFTLVLNTDKYFNESFPINIEFLNKFNNNFRKAIIIKLFGYWFLIGIPLIFAIPLLIYIIINNLSDFNFIIYLTYIMGINNIFLFGCLSTVLSLNFIYKNMIILLIIIPLYIPVIILGINCQLLFIETNTPLLLMIFISTILLMVIPLIISKILQFTYIA